MWWCQICIIYDYKDLCSISRYLSYSSKYLGQRTLTIGIESLCASPPVYSVWFSCFATVELVTALLVCSNSNQSNRRSAIQWYFPYGECSLPKATDKTILQQIFLFFIKFKVFGQIDTNFRENVNKNWVDIFGVPKNLANSRKNKKIPNFHFNCCLNRHWNELTRFVHNIKMDCSLLYNLAFCCWLESNPTGLCLLLGQELYTLWWKRMLQHGHKICAVLVPDLSGSNSFPSSIHSFFR